MKVELRFIGLAVTFMVAACSLTRNLDYLTNGGADAGALDLDGGDDDDGGLPTNIDSGPIVGDVLASAQYAPSNLVQDATNIYWTTSDNKVMKLPKAGGAAVQLALVAGSVSQIKQAVVDSSPTGNVYVLLDTGVLAVSKAGGTATPLVTDANGIQIAVDDTNLYVLNEIAPSDTDTSELDRYTLASPSTPPVVLSTTGTAPTSLLLTADAVFWTVTDESSNYVMLSLPKNADAGVAPTVYQNTASDQGSAIGIAPADATSIVIDNGTFYWVDDSEGAAYAEPLTPPVGQATTLLTAQDQDTFSGIAVDATSIYLTPSGDGDSNTLVRLPRSVGTATSPTVVATQTNPSEIITDDTSIYLAFDGPGEVSTNGGIVRIAK